MQKCCVFAIALLACTSLTHGAQAIDVGTLPTGGQVKSGSADISQSGAHMDIQQHSDKAIIHWQEFNVGRDAHVQFHQNSANAVALNRVIAGDASQIHGQISANGQVYLINPSGVVFGNSARVDVGGLVASTHNITDENFLAGKRIFQRNGATGKVVNKGQITGDDVVLIGTEVQNQGRIVADGGNIALAAGEQVTVSAGANGYLQVAVDGATVDTLVTNGGILQADGGQIVMTAHAANAAKAAVVNTGEVRARTLQHKNGQILLLADMQSGETQVAGTLDASAPDGGDGGFIETSAATVNVEDGTTITTKAVEGKTGTWLIDPDDFTIAASGGNISGATLSANLENTHQVIETNQAGSGGSGDLFVNDAVSWGADTTLTLRADRNIHINKNITATGDNAGLTLAYGRTTGGSNYYIGNGASVTLSGAAPVLQIGPNGSLQTYTVINSDTALQAMVSGGRYALGSNIDATDTVNWNGGDGYLPMSLGSGQLHGLGHTIDGLYVNRNDSAIGLFRSSAGGLIRDLGLTNASITGLYEVGGLVGVTYSGITLNNVFVIGNITATDSGNYGVGGLVGRMYNGTITNSYTAGTVSGEFGIGGIVGDAYSGSLLDQVYSSSSVVAQQYAGGLIGSMEDTTISNSYATGNVTAIQYAGGLVGSSSNASITNSYAAGPVSGALSGGIIGGTPSGTTVTNAYWNMDSTGQSTTGSNLGTGLDANQMMQMATFSGWDIGDEGGQSTIWRIYEGQTAPLLRQFLTPLTITANNASAYSGTPYSGGNGVSYSSTPDSNLMGSPVYGGTAQGATGTGTYTLSVAGFYSNQHGYDISYVDGQLVLTTPPPPPPPPPPPTPTPSADLPRDNSSTLSLTTVVTSPSDSLVADSLPTEEKEVLHATSNTTHASKSMGAFLTLEENYLTLPE